MATSGSTDFNVTAGEIIKDALIDLGVIGASESVSGEDYVYCLRKLNQMIKTWQGQGIHLFKKDFMDLFLEAGKTKYSLNLTSGDNATLESVITEVKVAIGSSDTSIDVDSTTGIAASDNIGIETDSGTIVWRTVSSVTDSDTLVLSSSLGVAASVDNRVYTYTTKADRPLAIHSIRRVDDSDLEIKLNKLSREEYLNIPDKDQEGEPLCWYYDPQMGTGELYIWPVSTDLGTHLKLDISKTFEDFDNSTDNPDFPVEFAETLTANLAVRIASAFDATDKLAAISVIAQETLQGVKGWDSEDASIYLVPDRGY